MELMKSLHDIALISRVSARAWKLMTVLCGTVSPTEELIPYIISWCSSTAGNRSLQTLPVVAATLLKRIAVLRKREELPTNAEISAILVCDSVVYGT